MQTADWGKMQTEDQMQTADCRLFNLILIPFLSLRANWCFVQANPSDIQANWGDTQSKQSADFHCG